MRKFWGLVQWTVGGFVPLLLIGSASAAIIGGSVTATNGVGSTFVQLSAPQSVAPDSFTSDSFFGLNEKQSVTLASDLAVDVGSTILAGTKVASHLVWFEPHTSTKWLQGVVQFSSKVLGVIYGENRLNATNGLLGNGLPSVYGNQPRWGMEVTQTLPNAVPEGVTFTGDTINFASTAFTSGDYARVITAVPEPGSVTILSLGAACLVFAAYRRRRNQPLA